eukprot:tig00021017_g17181.t1
MAPPSPAAPRLPRDKFVDQKHAQRLFECGICMQIFRDPTEVNCPEGHVFCKECIDRWIDEARRRDCTCPSCRKGPITKETCRINQHIRRSILDMDAYCENKDDGCCWQGALSGWPAHVAGCALTKRSCSGAPACEERLLTADLPAHEAICLHVRIPCPNADIGCPEELPRGSVADHLVCGCRRRCVERMEQLKRRTEQCEAQLKQSTEQHNAQLKRKAEQCDGLIMQCQGQQQRCERLLQRTRTHAVRHDADGGFVSFRVRVANWAGRRAKAEGKGLLTAVKENSVERLPWKLRLKTTNSTGEPHLAVFLRCTYKDNRRVKGRFAITLVNRQEDASITKKIRDNDELLPLGQGNAWGFSSFAAMADVSDPAKGFLHGGALVFQVTISDLETEQLPRGSAAQRAAGSGSSEDTSDSSEDDE